MWRRGDLRKEMMGAWRAWVAGGGAPAMKREEKRLASAEEMATAARAAAALRAAGKRPTALLAQQETGKFVVRYKMAVRNDVQGFHYNSAININSTQVREAGRYAGNVSQ